MPVVPKSAIVPTYEELAKRSSLPLWLGKAADWVLPSPMSLPGVPGMSLIKMPAAGSAKYASILSKVRGTAEPEGWGIAKNSLNYLLKTRDELKSAYEYGLRKGWGKPGEGQLWRELQEAELEISKLYNVIKGPWSQ